MNRTIEHTEGKQMVGRGDMAGLISVLREGDNFEREKVVEVLTSAPDSRMIELVVPLLYEDNTGVRMVAHEILRKVGGLALEKITDLLDSDNEDIRVYACEILASIGDKRALPHIIKKIYSDEDNVRNAACIALGEFSDKEAVRALLDALKDDEWIVFSAIYSLGRIRDLESVDSLLEIFRNGPEELSVAACEVLVDFDREEVMDEILGLLRQWDSGRRSMYLKAILEKGNERSFEVLRAKIGDELFEHLLSDLRDNKKRPVEFIKMLAHFRNKKTCDVILGILTKMDPEDDDFNSVLGMFASLSDVWAVHTDEYMDGNEECILPLLRACKMSGTKIREHLLLRAFRASSVELKREIIAMVPEIVDGSGREIALEGLNDIDGHVKGDAAIVAGHLKLFDLKDKIKETAREGFNDVRIKALKVLVGFDTDEALKLIHDFVNNGSEDDKKVYLAVAHLLGSEVNLPIIEKVLSGKDEGVRRSAVNVIGDFLYDARYLGLLEDMLSGPDIPHEALKVIKEKKPDGFTERLKKIFGDAEKSLWTRYYALAALGVFRDKSLFDIFVKGLSDENNLIKIACIKALADLREMRAVEYIMPFAGDPDDDIRSTAESAIAELSNTQGPGL